MKAVTGSGSLPGKDKPQVLSSTQVPFWFFLATSQPTMRWPSGTWKREVIDSMGSFESA